LTSEAACKSGAGLSSPFADSIKEKAIETEKLIAWTTPGFGLPWFSGLVCSALGTWQSTHRGSQVR